MRSLLLTIAIFLALNINAQNQFSKITQKVGSTESISERASLIDASKMIVSVGDYQDGGLSKGFFSKFDSTGNILLTKKISATSPIGSFTLTSIDNYTNGDYLVAGLQGFAEFQYFRLDNSGNVIWNKSFTNPGRIGPNQKALIDGSNAYVAFSSTSLSADAAEICILKIDNLGDTLWTKRSQINNTHFASYPEFGSELIDMVKLSNGNIMIASIIIGSGTQYRHILLSYYDQNGNHLQSKQAEISSYGEINLNNIVENSNSEICFFGSANNLPGQSQVGSAYFKTDLAGSFISGLLIGDESQHSVGLPSSDGGAFIGASRIELTSAPGAIKEENIGIYKLNTTNSLIWGNGYGGSEGNEINTLHKKNDNSLLFTATTTGFKSGYHPIHYMSGLDSLGMTSKCYSPVLTFPKESFSLSFVSITPQYNNNLTSSAITYNFTNEILTTTNIGYSISGNNIKPLCKGLQGTIDITPSGTFGSVAYNWSNGTNAEDLTDLAGTYSVIVKDGYGCIITDSFTLTEPTLVGASYSTTNVTCFGAANGAIDLTPSGGTPGYSYSWTNLDTTEDLTNLSGGFYQVTISDTNGCQKNVGVSVGEPQQLVSVITNTTHTSCNNVCDGELVVFASGGYAPYTYLWNDPMAQNTDTATGLCDAQYFVTVTDTNGCQTYANGTITEPLPLTSTMWESPTECGLSNGASGIIPSGGTLPYSILWWGTAITNDTITGLDFGQAGANVIDDNGCLLTDSIDVSTTTLGNENCLVSVSTGNKNKIIWEKPIAGNVSGYNIYRNIAGSYAQIAFHPYDSLSEYTDVTFGVDPNVTSYRYKVSVVDTCGFESGLSFYHETIHLTANLGVGGEVNLIWDDYEGASFSSYNIMLDSTETGNYHLVASVSAGSFTYTHLTPPQDSAEYIIEVVLDSTCTSTQKANHNSTRSNKGKVKSSSAGGTGTLSVQEFILNNSIIYPNPSKDIINIELKGVDKWNYQVFNVVGELIAENQDIDSENKILDIKDWSNGIYIIKLQVGKQTINKKIIKH